MALSVPLATRFANRSFANTPMKQPETALVVWYSQTSNTERTGKLIGKTLESMGIKTTASDYRDLKAGDTANYDMIVAGSPVYYYDVPSNFREWLKTIPSLSEKPVASFVTFGGEGGNQHNTACTLLELLSDKGGLPVGFDMFGNMSTFAITWSSGNSKRVLKYSHLPDSESYDRIRRYASELVERIRQGITTDIDKTIDFRELFKSTPSIWGTKLFISDHRIDNTRCIGCGTCVETCPVNAIDLSTGDIDTGRCIACLGCVNNCPEQAVNMEFLSKKVYGFNEFLKRNKISIREPEELVATKSIF